MHYSQHVPQHQSKHPTINYNILQWNVRSLTARLPSLQNLLSVQKCSIVIISETWLLPSRLLNLPNLKIFRTDRPDGYGGVAIAIHNSFKTKLIPIEGLYQKQIHQLQNRSHRSRGCSNRRFYPS